MEKDKRKNVKQNENDRRKWYSLIGFFNINCIVINCNIYVCKSRKNTKISTIKFR